MSPENARLVENGIGLLIFGWLFLVIPGKLPAPEKSVHFIEKNRKALTILCAVGAVYPIYQVCSVFFGWPPM